MHVKGYPFPERGTRFPKKGNRFPEEVSCFQNVVPGFCKTSIFWGFPNRVPGFSNGVPCFLKGVSVFLAKKRSPFQGDRVFHSEKLVTPFRKLGTLLGNYKIACVGLRVGRRRPSSRCSRTGRESCSPPGRTGRQHRT